MKVESFKSLTGVYHNTASKFIPQANQFHDCILKMYLLVPQKIS